jgi:hypothetical protein
LQKESIAEYCIIVEVQKGREGGREGGRDNSVEDRRQKYISNLNELLSLTLYYAYFGLIFTPYEYG